MAAHNIVTQRERHIPKSYLPYMVKCSVALTNWPILLSCLAYSLSEEVEDDTFQDAQDEMYTDSWDAVDVDLSQREPVELAQEPR